MSGHSETSAVIWQGQYLMYYRTFVNGDTGQTCGGGRPLGIAVATSNDGGNTWTPRDSGRPLGQLRTLYHDAHVCPPDDGGPSTWVYAPDVIVDGDHLTMVFERRDLQAGNPRPLHSIWWVTSTDGFNWTPQKRLLAPGNPGNWDDRVGTPDLEKDGSGYILTFHGDNDRAFNRAFIRLPQQLEENSGRPKTRIQLLPRPGWASYGPGLSDMVKEPDGFWYIIFEAFGGSGQCNLPTQQTSTAVGIARSMDLRVWQVRSDALITGDGDGMSCGHDMPAFQTGGAQGIVTTNDPPGGPLVRWRIA